MNEIEQLTALRDALAERDIDATIDTSITAIPVLWVPLPQTHSVREMVGISGGQRFRRYMWDGSYWPANDIGRAQLADRLTERVRAHPATVPDSLWGGGES